MKFYNNSVKIFLLKKNKFDLNQNLLNYKNTNNLLDLSHNYYMYSFFLKKNFLKIEGKSKKFILKNLYKYKTLSQMFLQNCITGGNKLKMLKFINKMNFSFYFFFLKKLDFFQKKFPTYNIFYNFSKTEKKFFDINFIFNLILKNNDSIFFTKAVKYDKKLKQRNKIKLKYNLDVKYLRQDKRSYFTLKQIHLYSNNYNFYNYSERLLMSLFNVFFFEKNSEIYKNKIMTYQNILKKNSK